MVTRRTMTDAAPSAVESLDGIALFLANLALVCHTLLYKRKGQEETQVKGTKRERRR